MPPAAATGLQLFSVFLLIRIVPHLPACHLTHTTLQSNHVLVNSYQPGEGILVRLGAGWQGCPPVPRLPAGGPAAVPVLVHASWS